MVHDAYDTLSTVEGDKRHAPKRLFRLHFFSDNDTCDTCDT